MPFYPELAKDPRVWVVLDRWGRELRRARATIDLSQMRLEELSGVDQTSISRFEHARAPRLPVEQVARLGLALGHWFPLGTCPHDHDCAWHPQVPMPATTPSRDDFLAWRKKTNGPGWLDPDPPAERPALSYILGDGPRW